jgi:Uma2 family endonuclease
LPALAGASRRHNRVVTNLTTALDNQLKDRPCNVYASNLRVWIASGERVLYPDVVVTCGDEHFLDAHEDVLLNPLVVIEVLSASTEAYDRGKKRELYQRLPSLQDYLLVAQDAERVEPSPCARCTRRYPAGEGGPGDLLRPHASRSRSG